MAHLLVAGRAPRGGVEVELRRPVGQAGDLLATRAQQLVATPLALAVDDVLTSSTGRTRWWSRLPLRHAGD